MALTLIATAGAANANAYATVQEADAYLEGRVGAAAWADLDAEQKDVALVTATRALDAFEFIGRRATSTQALEWPRVGMSYGSYGVDELPRRLVQATIEYAFAFLPALVAGAAAADPLVTTPSNVKEKTVGPITTVFFEPSGAPATALERLPDPVHRLLAPLVRAATPAATWGTGTAVRAS